MKKPYVKKIKEKNSYSIYYVDGEYIRKNIEKDFVGCSDSTKYKFIPKDELWIEREFSKKESKYYIDYFLAKMKYLSEGKKYREAVALADTIEQDERNKSKIIKKLKNLPRNEIIKKIRKKLFKKYSSDKIKIWLVNGFLVRTLFFLEFTAGGHDKIYEFIPENEIWIDDSPDPKSRDLIILHEIYERNLMSKDKESKTKQKSYEKSHEQALLLENKYRNNPKNISKRIIEEVKKT